MNFKNKNLIYYILLAILILFVAAFILIDWALQADPATSSKKHENTPIAAITPTPLSGDCQYLSWIGDGYCDDETNKTTCNYDGNDCCLKLVLGDFCKECFCYGTLSFHQVARADSLVTYKSDRSEDCRLKQWIGDGLCDDVTNIAQCSFDGGDCCLTNVNSTYCQRCLCTLTGNRTASKMFPLECYFPHLVGDGICDDILNDEECDFDGGDCKFTTQETTTTTMLRECAKPLWVKDGVCDDATNTELCSFDGGDCCLPQVDKTYCTLCLCQE